MHASFSAAFEFSSQGSVCHGRTQLDISMGAVMTSRSWECSSGTVDAADSSNIPHGELKPWFLPLKQSPISPA